MRRNVSLVAALALLATMVFAVPAFADGSLAERLDGARAAATGLGEDGAKAAEALTKALAPELWTDGDTLGEDGKKVFDQMKKAAKKLGDHPALASELASIATGLASNQMTTAADSGADLSKAGEKMAKAEAKMAEGKPENAIKELLKAWKEARKAKDKATGTSVVGGNGSGGKYAHYEIVFVRADTVSWETPVFMTLSATNEYGTPGHTGKGNEGYIFSPAFSAMDSFHSASLMHDGMQGMQLHVSCSDAFPGGYGAKSDPSIDSNWLINTATITKYKDGVAEKTCNVMGAGLPETTPTDLGGDLIGDDG